MKRHTYPSVLTTLSLIAGILFTGCSGSDNPGEIKTSAAVPVIVAMPDQATTHHIYASGQIESKETALISTRIMGFITSINVKTGDVVRKGQLLATISNGDIVAKKAQAQAMVLEAEAALKDAQKNHQRFYELYEQQSASTKEFENVTLQLNSIQAKTEAARQMQQEAEAMLAYTYLKAPFTGTVTQKNIDAGSMANPGQPILVMENSEAFDVRAYVAETDIPHIRQGGDAEIIIKSTGKIIHGKIVEISPSSQFSGGQYKIKVNIPDKEKAGLYSGMYVNIRIPVPAPGNNTVLVPSSAIVHKDQLTGLYTITENQTALLRWIRIGKVQGDKVEVLSGLRDDEKFILKSDGKLYDGAPVITK